LVINKTFSCSEVMIDGETEPTLACGGFSEVCTSINNTN